MGETDLKPVLYLKGPFRLESADGAVLRVSLRKAQALLVLLATAEQGRRERRWIEDRLWSDQDRERAAASLRQALSALRRVLSDNGVTLQADRQSLWLEPGALRVDSDGDGTFLEGFSAGDPVFQAWLDQERARHDGTPLPESRPAPAQSVWHVNIEIAEQDGPNGWFNLTFADIVARGLRETQNTPVSVLTRAEPSARLLTVAVSSVPFDGLLGVRVSLERRASNRQIWSGQRLLQMRGGPPTESQDCLSLANEVVGAVDQYLYRNSRDVGLDEPDRLYHQAVRDLFSMEPERIAAADAALDQALKLSERGLFLALRAQLKTIERVERLQNDTADLIEAAEAYSARALELEPDNSMVAAFLANTAGHLIRDQERSHELAQRSVDLNPANPMAWWALSSASMYLGRNQKALTYALNGQRLSARSQYRFWWDQQSFGTLFAIGKHEEAFEILKATHARNRNYRPPMRYLFALAAHFDDQTLAEEFLHKLEASEPNFSVTRMLEDPSYPASLIHSAPNLDLGKLRAFIK
ncbi:MAG: hypothetical protein ACU0AY_06115 [Marinibacterium profundimaris]